MDAKRRAESWPNVRMDDARLEEEAEAVKAGLRASPKGGVTAFQCLLIELRRSRNEELRLAVKPSESSMVQRIEAQRHVMIAIRAIAIHSRRVGSTAHDMSDGLQRIADAVTAMVGGPPDPERDRETTAEVLKP